MQSWLCMVGDGRNLDADDEDDENDLEDVIGVDLEEMGELGREWVAEDLADWRERKRYEAVSI